MMSKSSFLVNLLLNLRRRIWLIAVMMLFFFFSLPIHTAMALSNARKMYYVHPSEVTTLLGDIFSLNVGLDVFRGFMIAVLAIFAAIQGFSYMYQKPKLDLYLSEPVSRGRRFAAIYINGFLAYLLSYLFFLLQSFGVAAAMGANVGMALESAFVGIAGYTILYFAVYNLGILAVMLTGNIVVTHMAAGVFLFYDIVTVTLLKFHLTTFFRTYYSPQSDQKWDLLYFLPLSRFFIMAGEVVDYTRNWPVLKMDGSRLAVNMCAIFAAGLITLALAWIAYTRKPSEVCGKAIAFNRLKPIIKVFLMVPIGIGIGIVMYTLSGNNPIMLVFGLVLGVLLMHCIVEVIYDFDFRSVTNGWKSLLLSGLLVAVIELIFSFDLVGYDRFVPESEKMESAAIYFTDNYENYYKDGLVAVSGEEYMMENLEIRDKEPVCELASRRMGSDSSRYTRQLVALYRMKNGRTIYRTFPVNYLEDADLLGRIMDEEGYVETVSTAFNDDLFQKMVRPQIHLNTGISRIGLDGALLPKLREVYCQDRKEFTYEDQLKEIVQYEIQIEQPTSEKPGENEDYAYVTLPVYPSFHRTQAFLTQTLGYAPEAELVRADQIDSITVTNYNSNWNHTESATIDLTYGYEDRSVRMTYTDPSQVALIAEAFCPSVYYGYWTPATLVDGDFNAEVTLKDGSSMDSISYSLITDKIPDFVRADTVYIGSVK